MFTVLRYQHALEIMFPSVRIPEVKCSVEANQILCSGAHKLLAISRLLRRLFEGGTSDLFYQQKARRYNMSEQRIGRVVEELWKELPTIDIIDFFVIHSAIWPAVRMSQLVDCDQF